MRAIILAIIIVALAVLIGSAIKNDPGFVSISIADKIIETSLVFLVLVFLFAFTILFITLKIALFIYHIPEKLNTYRIKKNTYKARNNLIEGLIDLAEGKWVQAEKKLVKQVKYSDAKLINYLTAARAAQHQNAHNRRDAYLKKAIEANPQADIAVGITQAELQISHNQTEQAFATLNWLNKISPKHTYIKKLLAKMYVKLNEEQKLIDLIPELRNDKLLSPEKLDNLEIKAYIRQIDKLIAPLSNAENLWTSIPEDLKRNKEILYHYCLKLKELKAIKAIEECLKAQTAELWDERLILLYGQVDIEASSESLSFVESLLTENKHSSGLYLTLGRLCIKRELWGKAKTYFKQSIYHNPNIQAYQALAELHQKLNKTEKANENFKKGLELANKLA